MDYEILGKCTYVRKSTDGVAPSSKQVEVKNNTYYFVPVINSPSLVHFTYVKRRSADYWVICTPPVLSDTYVFDVSIICTGNLALHPSNLHSVASTFYLRKMTECR